MIAESVTCSVCHRFLFLLTEVCFYSKDDRISLMLKPELANLAQVSAMKIEEDEYYYRARCQNCNSNIGCQMPYGPDGAKYVALGTEKIVVCGVILKRKDRWRDKMKVLPFSKISVRDDMSFYGDISLPTAESAPSLKRIFLPVVFAKDDSDFEWKDLLLTKVPRKPQIEAYLESLQRDCIVVMPTGFGKTLVASMLMRKMSQLNPAKIAVMVVDRIPLVFQQAKAIEIDTGMRVKPLCSENKTKRSIKSLTDCEFGGLVVTAGSLVELLAAEQLSPEFFSVIVFDECHHSSGNHAYIKLLREFEKLPLSTRPRLLGLTASPFPAKVYATALKNMAALRNDFLNAVIFKPSLPPSHQEIIWRIVDWTPAQEQLISAITRYMYSLATTVNRLAGSEFMCSRDIENKGWPRVRGQLRMARDEGGQELTAVCSEFSALLVALELCDIVGVSAALDELKVASVTLPGAVIPPQGESPRLVRLLEEIASTSEEAKILVFVNTREAARVLSDVLKLKFPKLNPLRVVGHGGYDGMGWFEEQKDVIDSFREGHSRLLVSTSVLEEGLDVSECDLVIRFCGSSSLIQFIQSRGRARKVGARLVTILGAEDQQRVAELEAQERIMESVIQNAAALDSLPSPRTLHLIDTAQSSDPRNAILMATDEGDESALLTVESRIPVLRMFVDGEISIEGENFQRALIEALDQFGHMTVTRIHCMSRGAARLHSSPRVFGETDSAVLIGVKPIVQRVCGDCIADLCATWDFQIQNRALWIGLPPRREKDKLDSCISLNKVSVGYLLSKSTFDERDSFEASHVDFYKDTIKISIGGLLDKVIKVAILSINQCGILSADRHSGICKLFLPLSSVPIVEKISFDTLFHERVEFGDSHLMMVSAYPVLCLQIPLTHWRSLCCQLALPSLGVPFFLGRVTCLHYTDTIDQHVESVPSHSIRWSLGALATDWNLIISPEVIKNLARNISRVPPDIATAALDQLLYLANNTGSIWNDLSRMLETLLSSIQRLSSSEIPLPDNYTLVPSLFVTPSRVVISPHVVLQCSRFIRRFSDSKRILLVRFRDEQLQSLRDQSALPRVKDLLAEGLTVFGETFWFVSASQSQLRNHTAFFVAGSKADAEFIQRSLLPKPPEETAKLMSRLGLFCTSDTPVCNLAPRNEAEIPDLYNFKDCLLTDGSGLCNGTLAAELQGVSESPHSVAFQIRYRGMKGVVLYSPTLPVGEPLLQYRPSMVKCQSDDFSFCLVKAAKFTSLRLNREVITLLLSLRSTHNLVEWDVSSVVTDMQERELELLAQMLTNPVEAARRLSNYLDANWVASVVEAGVNLCTEPFWMSLLRVVYKRAARSLRSKTHLPVQDGCMLMGVPDPLGVLGENEVSIRFTRPNSDKVEVITGPVLIYRNPCLYPGDLRVVNAIDRPDLDHLLNVVVLTVKQSGHSLASECSGGDLDGDMFALIWDQRLVPPLSSVFLSLDYNAIAAAASAFMHPEALVCSLPEFYIRVISNDTLGRVAHLHLALCDLMPRGAADPVAIELAKSQSLAVDFPKTGVSPKVPEDALTIVDEKGYPDFMEKSSKDSYTSKNLLGELYRRCLSLTADTLGAVDTFFTQSPLECDAERSVMVKDAEQVYLAYECAIRRVMSRFGLKSEAEVVLGEAVHWHPLHSADRGKASHALRTCWQAIRRRFREQFLNGSGDLKLKARIWYQVAYSKPRPNALFSFAWLPKDLEVFVGFPTTPEFSSILGKTALQYYLTTRSVRRFTILGLQATFEKIKVGLSEFAEVALFGSAALFLSDADSDIDVFVRPLNPWATPGVDKLPPKDQQKQWLDSLIPWLDPLVSEKHTVYNSRIPIIKCKVIEEESETNVDVCACSDGLNKAKFILAQYRSRPEILPLFTLIVEWARACGLVRSVGIDCIPLLCGGELHALILKLLHLHNPVSPLTEALSYDDMSNPTVDCNALGCHILSFFCVGAKLQADFEFIWPIESSPRHFIPSAKCIQFATECQRMLHALSMSGSWCLAVEHCSLKAESQAPMVQLLSRSLTHHLERAVDFHSSRLSLVSGTQVTLEMDHARLRLEARGSRLQLRRLREELRHLARVGHSIGHLRQRTSAYFMDGSTFLFMRGMQSRDASVVFATYKEGCQRIHIFHERSQVLPLIVSEENASQAPSSSSSSSSSSWERRFISGFQQKVMLQMLPLRDHKSIPSLWLSVHFGNFYVTNAISACDSRLGSLSVADLETAVSAGRRCRRNLDDRWDWNHQNVEGQRQATLKKVSLQSASKEPSSCGTERRRGRSRKLCSSFYPCLASKSALVDRFAVVERGLLELGFVVVAESSGSTPTFLVNMIASTSYVVHVKLDSNLKLLSLTERPLTWIHSTLLRGSQDSKLDIRLKVTTTTPVGEDSDLFQFVFPDGVDHAPISVNATTGSVLPSEKLPSNIRDRVSFVRRIDSCLEFTLQGSGVSAKVAMGMHYGGRLLDHSEPFCDLSLEVDPLPLREWLGSQSEDAPLAVWLNQVVDVALQVSDKIPV